MDSTMSLPNYLVFLIRAIFVSNVKKRTRQKTFLITNVNKQNVVPAVRETIHTTKFLKMKTSLKYPAKIVGGDSLESHGKSIINCTESIDKG